MTSRCSGNLRIVLCRSNSQISFNLWWASCAVAVVATPVAPVATLQTADAAKATANLALCFRWLPQRKPNRNGHHGHYFAPRLSSLSAPLHIHIRSISSPLLLLPLPFPPNTDVTDASTGQGTKAIRNWGEMFTLKLAKNEWKYKTKNRQIRIDFRWWRPLFIENSQKKKKKYIFLELFEFWLLYLLLLFIFFLHNSYFLLFWFLFCNGRRRRRQDGRRKSGA